MNIYTNETLQTIHDNISIIPTQ